MTAGGERISAWRSTQIFLLSREGKRCLSSPKSVHTMRMHNQHQAIKGKERPRPASLKHRPSQRCSINSRSFPASLSRCANLDQGLPGACSKLGPTRRTRIGILDFMLRLPRAFHVAPATQGLSECELILTNSGGDSTDDVRFRVFPVCLSPASLLGRVGKGAAGEPPVPQNRYR
jgi:hypothetical protein